MEGVEEDGGPRGEEEEKGLELPTRISSESVSDGLRGSGQCRRNHRAVSEQVTVYGVGIEAQRVLGGVTHSELTDGPAYAGRCPAAARARPRRC